MDPRVDIGFVFADALLEVISTVSGFSLEETDQEPDVNFNDMTAVMNFYGEMSGMLFVSSNKPDMRAICSYMIGVPIEDVTDSDIEDALCELANMTAGNAKLRFGHAENVFTLTPPFLIKGKTMSISAKSKTHVVSRTLGNGDISVKLKIVY